MLAPSNLCAKLGVTVGGLGKMRRRLHNSRRNPGRSASSPLVGGLRTGWALGMRDTDDRKPLTPAELIEQIERSNPTVIAQVLADEITLREKLLLRAWLRPRSATEPLQ
jgi:hypothetical protein